MKKISDELGFCFIVYQNTLNGNFIKCWIDGDENYKYITRDEFIGYTKKSPLCTVYYDLVESLTYSSVFLWDIDSNVIRRLHATGSENTSIRSYIKSELQSNSTPNDSISVSLAQNFINLKR